jgi:hypothetical protein
MTPEHEPPRGTGEPESSFGAREQDLAERRDWEDDEARGGSAEPGASAAPASAATSTEAGESGTAREGRRRSSENMLPGREVRRSGAERLLVRLIATCGIVAIGVAIAAIMVSSHSQGWIVGLVVSIVSVVLAAILWSSKML